MRSTAVCPTTFRRDLFLRLLNLNQTISAITALQAVIQLEVTFLLFIVLRDELLAIYRPVHFASLA